MSVGQGLSRSPGLGKLAPPGMTEPAGLDLGTKRAGRGTPPDVAGFGMGRPRRIASLAKSFRQSHGRVADPSKRPPAAFISRPTNMAGALTVASFATNADLRESRCEPVVCRVVILPNAGRVALRAHEVPVLVELRPMQDIVVADFLLRIKVKPALTAFVFWSAVPGDGQCLQSTVRKFDEILLQRVNTKRVFDLKDIKLAIRAIGFGQELF